MAEQFLEYPEMGGNAGKDETARDEFDAAFAEASEQDGAPASAASVESDKHGAAADPTEPAPQGQQAQDTPAVDHDDLARKAHGYDSMLGRLQAEQRKNQDLLDRLSQLEKQQPDAPAQPSSVKVSDDLKAELEDLAKRDPRYAALALEDSPEGERLRSGLEEFGVDFAAERADTVLMRRDVDARLNAVQTTATTAAEAAVVQTFYATVATKHDDWVALATNPDKRAEYDQYMSGMRQWAENRPYAEGVEAFRIMEKGTPAEVISLLDRYKESTGTGARSASSAADALAVPSRPGPPPSRTRAPKDDFDAGFEEALRE